MIRNCRRRLRIPEKFPPFSSPSPCAVCWCPEDVRSSGLAAIDLHADEETCQIPSNPRHTPPQKLIRGRKVSHSFPASFPPQAVYPSCSILAREKWRVLSALSPSVLLFFLLWFMLCRFRIIFSGSLSSALSKHGYAILFLFVKLLDLRSPLPWFTLPSVW